MSHLSGLQVFDFTFSGNNLYVGTYHDGIFRTSDNGKNWFQINNGLTNTDIRALASNDTSLFAATFGNGVFYSSNDGENWIAVNSGMENTRVIALSINDNYIFAGTDEGMFRSSDNGNNWIQINNGLTNTAIRSLTANNSNLYAGTQNGVYISTDNGDSWIAKNNGMENSNILDLINNDNLLIAGTSGTFEISEGIYRSSDYGNTWTNVNSEISSVFSLARKDTNIVAGTGWCGIFISTDLGINWAPFNNGLLPYITIYALIFSDSYIFAGTDNGHVYRRSYPLITSVDEETTQFPSDFKLSQNYPNPFNPVTKIEYQVAALNYVSLKVYDILGNEIAALVNGEIPAGKYEIEFDARNLPGGVYIYRIMAGKYQETKKMILLK